MINRHWLIVAFIGLLLAISVAACTSPDDASKGCNEGQRVPDFTLRTIDGEKINLSDYRGKVVMIYYWHTGCPFCLKEMPCIQSAYDALAISGLEIVAINPLDGTNRLKSFIEREGYTFPILVDPNKELRQKCSWPSMYPISLFLDENGISRLVVVGALTDYAVYRGAGDWSWENPNSYEHIVRNFFTWMARCP